MSRTLRWSSCHRRVSKCRDQAGRQVTYFVRGVAREHVSLVELISRDPAQQRQEPRGDFGFGRLGVPGGQLFQTL